MTDDETKQRAREINEALAANFLCVDISLRAYSGKSIDREVSEEIIHNKGAIRGSGKFVKDLFAGADAEIKEVNSLGNAVRSIIYNRTIPLSNNSSGAKRGLRLVNAMDSLGLLREITPAIADHSAATDRLVQVYDLRVSEALNNLSGMGKRSDYPAKEDIKQRFAITVDLLPVPSIVDYSRTSIPANLAEGLSQRRADMVMAQFNNGMTDLKQRLLEKLQNMADMLGKQGSGEKTRLFDTLVTNLQELVGLTRSMNAAMQNPELTALADKIEDQLLRHPVEVYRLHPKKAAEVAQAAQALAVDAALDEIWK